MAPKAITCPSSFQVSVIQDTSIVVCFLSALGSLLIVFSFIFYKSLRSKVRFLLVNLSLMDFGVGVSNVFGVLYNYDGYLTNDSNPVLTDGAQRVCIAQAFFAVWCTYSSIIWTILLSAYLYLLVSHHRYASYKYALLTFYVLAYGIPLLSTLWLLRTQRLGYAPYDSAGWCTIILTDTNGQNPDVFVTVVGYDIWIYLSFVLVPVFCLAVHLRIKDELRLSEKTGLSQSAVKELYTIHYKFLAIPAFFILLRVWTCVINFILVYIPVHSPNCTLLFVLLLLSGIGDSGQGMTNALLYILLSKTVRSSIWRKLQIFRKSTKSVQASLSMYRSDDGVA